MLWWSEHGFWDQSVSCPVMSDSLLPYGLWSARLLCSWNSGILEWVAISFSRRSSWPRDQTRVSYTAGRFFTIWATREAPWRPKPLFKSLPGSKWWLHHWYIYGFGQVLWLLGAHSFTFKGEKWCLIPCLHVCKDGSRCECLAHRRYPKLTAATIITKGFISM